MILVVDRCQDHRSSFRVGNSKVIVKGTGFIVEQNIPQNAFATPMMKFKSGAKCHRNWILKQLGDELTLPYRSVNISIVAKIVASRNLISRNPGEGIQGSTKTTREAEFPISFCRYRKADRCGPS